MPLQLFDLLNKGYFPKELPPPFTTETYAKAFAGPYAVHLPVVFLRTLGTLYPVHITLLEQEVFEGISVFRILNISSV